MATIVNSRIRIKQSTVPSQEPTIPASNDHTDGSWLITDIYEGEFFWNIPDKKLYQRSGSSIVQIMDEDSIASILGDYYAKSETDDLLDEKLSKSIVVSSDHTAVLDEVYHNVASATYTDPTPVEGKGFTVLVINGTATVGGTAYATAGTIIVRTYHSGSWSNYVYNDKAINDSLYLSLGGGTLTGALTAPSFTINGTAGNGFMSLINQSSNPSAVSGTIRLFADSSANLTWVRRNNANSANIRRTLIMPDQNIDYTFPTPASGTASTLAGLSTAQTWTQTQTFATERSTKLQILSGGAGSTYLTALDSVTNTRLRIGNEFTDILIDKPIYNWVGTNTRLVESAADGTSQAIEEIVPLQIFNYSAITLLANDANWNNGVYVGSSLATYGLSQGQFLTDANWFYWMVDTVTPVRMPISRSVERGLYTNFTYALIAAADSSTPTTLSTYTDTKRYLANVGDTVEVKYTGKFVGNTTSKKLIFKLSGTEVWNSEENGSYGSNDGVFWEVNVRLVHVANNSQLFVITFKATYNGSFQIFTKTVRPTIATASDIVYELQGVDSGNNSQQCIGHESTVIKFKPFI